jgi:leader peptidase (prepilin peptidase)/N-methyltransferase
VLAAAPQPLIAEARQRAISWRGAGWLGLAVAAAGLAAVAGADWIGDKAQAWRWGLIAASLCAVAVVDACWLVIPDLYVAALFALAVGWMDWPSALLGAAIGGGLLAAMRWAFLRLREVEALGWGDVKLMAALGALSGGHQVLWIIVAASIIGIAVALVRGRADGGLRLAPLGACAAAPALAVLGFDRLAALMGAL